MPQSGAARRAGGAFTGARGDHEEPKVEQLWLRDLAPARSTACTGRSTFSHAAGAVRRPAPTPPLGTSSAARRRLRLRTSTTAGSRMRQKAAFTQRLAGAEYVAPKECPFSDVLTDHLFLQAHGLYERPRDQRRWAEQNVPPVRIGQPWGMAALINRFHGASAAYRRQRGMIAFAPTSKIHELGLSTRRSSGCVRRR